MEEQTMTSSPKTGIGPKIVTMFLLVVITIALVTVAVFVVIKPVKIELSQLDPQFEAQKNTVSVSGTGKVKVVPDVATVSIGSYVVADTTEKAQNENSTKINAVLSALRELGILDKDIQTSAYEVRPEYAWENNNNVDKGFRASQYLTVTIRDLAQAGKILTKASQVGANDIGGVNFIVEDIEKYKTQALADAYKNAEERAQLLMQSSGQELGAVISLKESGTSSIPPIFYGDSRESVVSDESKNIVPEIPTGEEEITSSVEAIYEIK